MKKKRVSHRIGGRHKGNPFQEARTRAGLTQDQAAKEIRCEPRTLRRYETGERIPRSDIVQPMMRVYDYKFSVLFTTELLPEDEKAIL